MCSYLERIACQHFLDLHSEIFTWVKNTGADIRYSFWRGHCSDSVPSFQLFMEWTSLYPDSFVYLFCHLLKIYSFWWCNMPLIPQLRRKRQGRCVSLNPALSTEWVSGQPGLYRKKNSLEKNRFIIHISRLDFPPSTPPSPSPHPSHCRSTTFWH